MAVDQRVTWQPGAYAGFWQRVAGTLIDAMLVLVLLFAVALVVGFVGVGAGAEDIDAFAGTAGSAINVLFVIGYFVYDTVLTARQGATIGKRAAGIEVRRLDGTLPSYALCVGRYFARVVSAVPFLLGYLWPAFDERKQTFHDKICSTVVVKRAEVRPLDGVTPTWATGASATGGWGAPDAATPASAPAPEAGWGAASPSGASAAGASPASWGAAAAAGSMAGSGSGASVSGTSGLRGTSMETASWGRPEEPREPRPEPGAAAGEPAGSQDQPARPPQPTWADQPTQQPGRGEPGQQGWGEPPRPAPEPSVPRADDPNLVAVRRAGLPGEAAAWLEQVAAQVDPRLRRVNPDWHTSPQAEAARACAFGILLGHLARMHPHMTADLSRVAEVHPSFSTLLEGSRLATLEQIASDVGRATAWLGPLIDVEDRDRVAGLLA